MVKVNTGDETLEKSLKLKVRLDFKGENKGKFIFGNKNIEKTAEEARDQHVALIRNVPFQGISVEDIDVGMEIYTVYDETVGEEIAYAPVTLTIIADTMEDVIKFTMREEFRKVELLEPENFYFTKQDAERMLFKMNQELKTYKETIEKKYNIK